MTTTTGEVLAAALLFAYGQMAYVKPQAQAVPEAAVEERADQSNGLIETKSIIVTATAYSPTPEECDNTPFITASGRRVRPGIIALSRDIEREFGVRFGDVLYLEGLGYYQFQDRMHRRWKRRVDIFHTTKQEAENFGLLRNVRVYLPLKATAQTASS
jgi:3D (Asp-Asp-Asp) domain-containing protein